MVALGIIYSDHLIVLLIASLLLLCIVYLSIYLLIAAGTQRLFPLVLTGRGLGIETQSKVITHGAHIGAALVCHTLPPLSIGGGRGGGGDTLLPCAS